jgi:hypothetical protein
VPPLAAPARYDDLSGLPSAWIGVGTNDLFHDEDVTYARRLQQAGVASTLHVVPGAYHNFDSIEAKTAVSQAFLQAQTTALDEALNAAERTHTTVSRPHLPRTAEGNARRGATSRSAPDVPRTADRPAPSEPAGPPSGRRPSARSAVGQVLSNATSRSRPSGRRRAPSPAPPAIAEGNKSSSGASSTSGLSAEAVQVQFPCPRGTLARRAIATNQATRADLVMGIRVHVFAPPPPGQLPPTAAQTTWLLSKMEACDMSSCVGTPTTTGTS